MNRGKWTKFVPSKIICIVKRSLTDKEVVMLYKDNSLLKLFLGTFCQGSRCIVSGA